MQDTNKDKIRVVELFAGVGGFRIGLEGASDVYDTVWNNQWEPSTVHQDASLVYKARFGSKGHCNQDINTVATEDIPDHDLLVGGFPCQDYSVASTLSRSGGIEGKKGVLWWQIYRILDEKGSKRPSYLSSRTWTACSARLPSSAGATLPSFWHRSPTLATRWSGVSSMLPNMACLSAAAAPTSWAIARARPWLPR